MNAKRNKVHRTRQKKFIGLISDQSLSYRQMVESRKRALQRDSNPDPCLSALQTFSSSRPTNQQPLTDNPYPRSENEFRKLENIPGALKTERTSDSDGQDSPRSRNLNLPRVLGRPPLAEVRSPVYPGLPGYYGPEPSFYRHPRQRLRSVMKTPEYYYNPAEAAKKLPPHKMPKILLTKEFQRSLKKKKRGRPRKYARPEDLCHPERLDLMASPPRDESAFIFLRKLARGQQKDHKPFLSRRAEFDAVNALMGLRQGPAPPQAPKVKSEYSPSYGADRSRSGSRSPHYSPYALPTLERASRQQNPTEEPADGKQPYMAILDRKHHAPDPEWKPGSQPNKTK
jgi:hypothetical protein